MQQKGKVADHFIFSFTLKISGQLTAVDLRRHIHCLYTEAGLDFHVFASESYPSSICMDRMRFSVMEHSL